MDRGLCAPTVGSPACGAGSPEKRPMGPWYRAGSRIAIETILAARPLFVNSGSRLPSFLLDVGYDGPADQDNIRLHATSEGETTHYTALSHCWGGVVSVMTTRIPWKPTPRKAPLSHHFRQPFATPSWSPGPLESDLWIDCLCIIQDDESHWQIESSRTASVYHRATLVLGATMSPNSHVGFNPDRPALRRHAENCSAHHWDHNQRRWIGFKLAMSARCYAPEPTRAPVSKQLGPQDDGARCLIVGGRCRSTCSPRAFVHF